MDFFKIIWVVWLISILSSCTGGKSNGSYFGFITKIHTDASINYWTGILNQGGNEGFLDRDLTEFKVYSPPTIAKMKKAYKAGKPVNVIFRDSEVVDIVDINDNDL